MQDLNVVSLVGRVVRDARLAYTAGGTAAVNFSLAVNSTKKRNGKYEDKADFFDCALFGRLAEAIAQYLTKGKQVSLSGRLEQQSWEKDGARYTKVVVIADNVQLLSAGKREEERSGARQADEGQENPGGFIF